MYHKLVIVWNTEFPEAIGVRLYLEQDWPMFSIDAAEAAVGGQLLSCDHVSDGRRASSDTCIERSYSGASLPLWLAYCQSSEEHLCLIYFL